MIGKGTGKQVVLLAVAGQATALQSGCVVWNVDNSMQHENVSPNLIFVQMYSEHSEHQSSCYFHCSGGKEWSHI